MTGQHPSICLSSVLKMPLQPGLKRHKHPASTLKIKTWNISKTSGTETRKPGRLYYVYSSMESDLPSLI